MREIEYYEMYELEINNDSMKKIVDIISSKRTFEKKLSVKTIPNKFKVIYCNCSDGDILDEDVSDAFYIRSYSQILFIDPDYGKDIWILISHELIHDIQNEYYVFMDDKDVPYLEQWQEIMARELEEEVKEIILKGKVKYIKTKEGHENINNYLENINILSYSTLNIDLEEEENNKKVNFIDSYFYERLEKHIY